jgi:hypothetical protein
MACSSCGYRFVLDPKVDGLADRKFLAAVRRASANDTYHYTKEQLYAAHARGQSRSPKIPAIVGGICAAAGLLVWFANSALGALALVAGAVAIICLIMAVARALRRPPNRREWDGIVAKWQTSKRRDALAKMITEPRLGTPPPEWQEPDIYDYGVERILIVERDLLVDLFVLNGLHAEHRALVLSETGYPDYLVPRARHCLEENDQLPVLLLHDATRHGVAMEQRLRGSSLLPLAERPIKDLGLFPDDVRKLAQLRPVGGGSRGLGVPADALLYGALVAGLSDCFAQDVALADLIEQRRKDTTDASGFG